MASNGTQNNQQRKQALQQLKICLLYTSIVFVGGLFTPQMAEGALQAGAGDLAAIGRNFLIEPSWPEKARRGEPVQTCLDVYKRQHLWPAWHVP